MNVGAVVSAAALALAFGVGGAGAVELRLPSAARLTVERNTPLDRYAAPVGVFANDTLPAVAIDGPVARGVWRLDVADLTPLQLIEPLRTQIEDAGFRIVLDCAAEACGGYDFRFATEVLPGPNMYVNIRNYHIITGLRGPEGAPEAAITVLASSSGTSYIQIIQAGGMGEAGLPEVAVEPPAEQAVVPPESFGGALARDGHVVLSSLEFDSGTSTLGPGPFDALAALADVLQAQPDLRIALVGHTDTVGGLALNITLSRARARSVRARLIEEYGIDSARLDAEGMGYLAPLTTNATAEGRESNRRVEAILLAP